MLKVEIKIAYDNYLSQLYFKDFINGMDGTSVQTFHGRNGVEYVVIYENEELRKDSYFKKSHLNKMRKGELLELGEDYDLYHLNNAYTKADIIEELLLISNDRGYEVHFHNTNFNDLDCDFHAHGYSQGECIAVKKVGKAYYEREDIENLFYKSPISGSIELIELHSEQVEFTNDCVCKPLISLPINELIEDLYEYDREEIIANFKELELSTLFSEETLDYLKNKYKYDLKEYMVDYLKYNLPEYLDYIG